MNNINYIANADGTISVMEVDVDSREFQQDLQVAVDQTCKLMEVTYGGAKPEQIERLATKMRALVSTHSCHCDNCRNVAYTLLVNPEHKQLLPLAVKATLLAYLKNGMNQAAAHYKQIVAPTEFLMGVLHETSHETICTAMATVTAEGIQVYVMTVKGLVPHKMAETDRFVPTTVLDNTRYTHVVEAYRANPEFLVGLGEEGAYVDKDILGAVEPKPRKKVPNVQVLVLNEPSIEQLARLGKISEALELVEPDELAKIMEDMDEMEDGMMVFNYDVSQTKH